MAMYISAIAMAEIPYDTMNLPFPSGARYLSEFLGLNVPDILEDPLGEDDIESFVTESMGPRGDRLR